MKQILLTAMLLCGSAVLWAQGDSALRYRIPSQSFQQAVNTRLQQLITADPNDTGEGGEVREFMRKQAAY